MPDPVTLDTSKIQTEPNPKKRYKAPPITGNFVKAIDEKKRQLTLVWNKLAIDRDGEVLLPSGAEFDAFLAGGGVGLFNHNNMNLPVVNTLEIEGDELELRALMQFMTAEESPIAEHLWLLYSRGKMRSFSHWFLPKAWTDEAVLIGQSGRTYTLWEVLEIGPVNVASLREAMVTQRSLEPALVKSFEELTGEEWKPAEILPDPTMRQALPTNGPFIIEDSTVSVCFNGFAPQNQGTGNASNYGFTFPVHTGSTIDPKDFNDDWTKSGSVWPGCPMFSVGVEDPELDKSGSATNDLPDNSDMEKEAEELCGLIELTDIISDCVEGINLLTDRA